MLQNILQQSFLENTLLDFIWFIGIVLIGLIFKRLISRILTRFVFKFLKKYSTAVSFDKLLNILQKPLGIFILSIAFYLAINKLRFPTAWNLVPSNTFGLKMSIHYSFQIAIVFSFTWVILRIVDFLGLIMAYHASLTESKSDDQLIPYIKEGLKIVIVIFSIFFILGAIFHLNITSLIAGLGIGGLAIALAAKESLENLLGSFTIFLDKPFVIGDLVQIGNVKGNIERIGFRSTRIRTTEKSLVTVPNKKMVEAELDNLTLRSQRRVSFSIGLLYQTSPAQLKSLIDDIRIFIKEHPQINENESRIHFDELGITSLNLFLEYFILTNTADTYLKVREEMNFKIMELVKKHGSDFAFPTSTVYLHEEKKKS